MPKERVAIYIDGFNLYHALCGLGADHLKWVNLRKLGKLLIRSRSQDLVRVCYFSAYADFLKGTEKEASVHRHRAYVAALEAKGVEFIPGNFARRKWDYSGGRRYKAVWRRHEEKQTDVAIAARVIRDAFRDDFDVGLIVSNDSDMVPIFKTLRCEFSQKQVITVSPPGRNHNPALVAEASGHQRINRSQIEKALFGPRVVSGGCVVAHRPRAYAPPP
jgi:uncharacterized LabA/DUF88 family protein